MANFKPFLFLFLNSFNFLAYLSFHVFRFKNRSPLSQFDKKKRKCFGYLVKNDRDFGIENLLILKRREAYT